MCFFIIHESRLNTFYHLDIIVPLDIKEEFSNKIGA